MSLSSSMRFIAILTLVVLHVSVAEISDAKTNSIRGRKSVNYAIYASKVLRPNTIYKIVVQSFPDSVASRVVASISRGGVAIASNEDLLPADGGVVNIPLHIPSDNSNGTAQYKLRVEGHMKDGRGMVFEEERILEFSRNFLSITISTSKVIYNAEDIIRIRVVMFTTAMRPYTGIVDLFLLDPDGYVVRKWNSQELNVGVLSQEYILPLYPKVGFWTIRVQAETQTEELQIKVEKHYLAKYELMVLMPSFVLDTSESIEASVEGSYIVERPAFGNITISWYAKRIDHQNWRFNDTVLHRENYRYYSQISNIYRNSYFNLQSEENVAQNPFIDLLANSSFAPKKPLYQEWVPIRTEFRPYLPHVPSDPFFLYLSEIETVMGKLENVQIRAEASMTEFFYNHTEHAFAETRIIHQRPFLRFLGNPPFVFKPGMSFEGQVAVSFDNYVEMDSDLLEESALTLQSYVILDNGNEVPLEQSLIPPLRIPEVAKPAEDGDEEDEHKELIDKYREFHELQSRKEIFGVKFDPDYQDPDEDADREDETDQEDQRQVEDAEDLYDYDYEYEHHADLFPSSEDYQFAKLSQTFENLTLEAPNIEFRSSGVLRFRLDTPANAVRLKIEASFIHPEIGQTTAEAVAIAAKSPSNSFIKVSCSTKSIHIGHYVVFHAKPSFATTHIDWIVMSKDIFVNAGREYSQSRAVHPEVFTFSVVVNSAMTPGFHMVVLTTKGDEMVSDSIFVPVDYIENEKIEFRTVQIKDHNQLTVEVTLRGEPGAIFLVSTVRQFLSPTQGAYSLSRAKIMKSFLSLESNPTHLHRLFHTSREGEVQDELIIYPSYDRHVFATRSLVSKNIMVMTNYLQTESSLNELCNDTLNELPCLESGCFHKSRLCDGIQDCPDGFDERDCARPEEEVLGQILAYRFSRQSRFNDFYDIGDGDWGWITTNMDEDGEQE